MSEIVYTCPLCGSNRAKSAFPWAIRFEGIRFGYHRCAKCHSVFIYPIPENSLLQRLYEKSTYHDAHYLTCKYEPYDNAAAKLLQYAKVGSTVLDYGCGAGFFLRACKSSGFIVSGVEFDSEVAVLTENEVGCKVWTVSDFFSRLEYQQFDVIHLGDVLEHLSDPNRVMNHLLAYLKPGGLLFAEGPLEINPSPVYWASRLVGTIKHLLRPEFVGIGKPLHLFRTTERQQLAFFSRIMPEFSVIHWQVYETGWPYADNGLIKNFISQVAIALSGRRVGAVTFGNRFAGIFRANGRVVSP